MGVFAFDHELQFKIERDSRMQLLDALAAGQLLPGTSEKFDPLDIRERTKREVQDGLTAIEHSTNQFLIEDKIRADIKIREGFLESKRLMSVAARLGNEWAISQVTDTTDRAYTNSRDSSRPWLRLLDDFQLTLTKNDNAAKFESAFKLNQMLEQYGVDFNSERIWELSCKYIVLEPEEINECLNLIRNIASEYKVDFPEQIDFSTIYHTEMSSN